MHPSNGGGGATESEMEIWTIFTQEMTSEVCSASYSLILQCSFCVCVISAFTSLVLFMCFRPENQIIRLVRNMDKQM